MIYVTLVELPFSHGSSIIGILLGSVVPLTFGGMDEKLFIVSEMPINVKVVSMHALHNKSHTFTMVVKRIFFSFNLDFDFTKAIIATMTRIILIVFPFGSEVRYSIRGHGARGQGTG